MCESVIRKNFEFNLHVYALFFKGFTYPWPSVFLIMLLDWIYGSLMFLVYCTNYLMCLPACVCRMSKVLHFKLVQYKGSLKLIMQLNNFF